MQLQLKYGTNWCFGAIETQEQLSTHLILNLFDLLHRRHGDNTQGRSLPLLLDTQ
jgi:hypothetical protein